ncbi:MAG TPA: type II toxin-antitoxin system RelE/ParE family toxin [Pyrinomonadaceae bacterium]|nr:type II toxin-antitoxin system RelE/ParE family toxin [Pyrinomonadaceae bacterium]
MKLALFLLPRAEKDIDSHCEFWAEKSVKKALAFDQAVFETFDRLCEMPLIGTERNYSSPKLFGIRIWFVKGFEKYLIFYRSFGNYLEIVRVLHSAQDTDSILEEESIN